jgi:hypothetical protein
VKGQGQSVVIPDHAVLTQPEDSSQAAQVSTAAGIINLIEQGGSDYRSEKDSGPNDYQNDNADLDTALTALRLGGLTRPAA